MVGESAYDCDYDCVLDGHLQVEKRNFYLFSQHSMFSVISNQSIENNYNNPKQILFTNLLIIIRTERSTEPPWHLS